MAEGWISRGPPDSWPPCFLFVAREDTEADRGRQLFREGDEAQSADFAARHPQVTPSLHWHPGCRHGYSPGGGGGLLPPRVLTGVSRLDCTNSSGYPSLFEAWQTSAPGPGGAQRCYVPTTGPHLGLLNRGSRCSHPAVSPTARPLHD